MSFERVETDNFNKNKINTFQNVGYDKDSFE